MAAARLLSFMLALLSTVQSIPTPCNSQIRFPYVFGLEDVKETPSYNTSVLNMIVVPNTVEVGVIAAVWSQSKMYFYGGTDHGDAGGYHGVVWMKENDHDFRFKTAFTKNQEVLANLVPVILALDPNEDHIVVVYADTQNQYLNVAGKIRFAFRLLSAATGAIEKSMALEPSHLNDKQISMMRNTMSYYKGDYLYFMISTFDSSFRMIFFRIDLSLPSGTNHFYRAYTTNERIRVMKYILRPSVPGGIPAIDYFIGGGCGYFPDNSGQLGCLDKLFFINCSPSPNYLAADHPIVSIYHDSGPVDSNYFSNINTFEVVALITRTRGNTGHIQFVVQTQCRADYGSFSTVCNPALSNSFVVRHSTIDFNAPNPHTTLSLSSPYRVIFETHERFEIIDGDFLGDMPDFSDIDSVWLMWSHDTDTLHIYRVSEFSSFVGMGHVKVQITINGQGNWPNYMRPNLNLNLGYISKRVDAWGTDDMIVFLSMNSQLDGGNTEYKVIPASSSSAYSLLTTAPQGIVLALKQNNDITCIDATVPTTTESMLVAGAALNSNHFSTWIGEMALIYSGGGTIEAGSHSFMIATSSTSLWEAESSTDQFSIEVVERAASFTKTADDSSFCQFVDNSLYGQDPEPDWALRTFKRSSYLVAFTDGTLHDFTTIVTSSSNLAYLHLPPLECTNNCDPFEANTCGNPLVFYQRTVLSGISNFYYPSSDPIVSSTTLLTMSVLEKIQPRAPHSQVLGFHLAELSHSYASSGTLMDSISFPTAYQTMKLGFEITKNTWDRECVTPSDYFPFLNFAADEFASFDKIPLFFVSEQVQVQQMTLIPMHKYPFSCQVSDFQIFIKKADGSWVELYDSISGQPTHSDPQDQKMSAMMDFSKAYSTPVDPAHNDLAWMLNHLKVDVSFQAMVEPSGAYAGLSVDDFKTLFTEPADKYINDSPPWNSTNQQFFRMAQLKTRPYIGSTLTVTEVVFNLYFIFCGEDLTVSDENMADVKSTSYLAPNKIAFDSRYEKHILKVDLTSSTSESYSFESHQFCTQAQCGASNDVCQDPTKHPFTHTYQVMQKIGGTYSAAPSPITIASAFGASSNSQVLEVDKDLAYSLESYGPVENVVIQLANGMRGGAGIDTIQFDVWLCTEEWFSASLLIVRYDRTLSMQIGNSFSASIELSGIPALVGSSSFAKFFPIDTGNPTISASLEKTSTNLNPPRFTLTVETSDTQFTGQSMDLAFDFITCFGKNLTIQIPVYLSNSFEADTAFLGQKAYYDLGKYSQDLAIVHQTSISSIDTTNSTCSSYLRDLPLSIRKITKNEIIQLSLKVDLAKAPISCEGATMFVRIDLEVDSVSFGPVVKELSLKCLFNNALCISPDFDPISEDAEGDPSVEADPSVEEVSGENGANPPSESNSTSETTVVEPPLDLEEGLLSLIIGGQVFVYDAVEEDPKPEPPKYTMERVDKDGKSALKFDQPMMRPLDLAKIDYSEVFRFEVISVLDGSAYQGQWIPSVTTTNRTRNLASDEVASNELTFTWQVTCWETYSICFQFNFSTPANVSSTAFGRDTLKGKVLDISYFLSASTHLSVDAEEVEPIGGPIMAQGLSPTLAENIEQLVAVVSDVGNTAGTSNLLIFYLLGASKQKLWSLMNAMQTIIYSTMADVNLPAHASFFFKHVFEFAKMDVFSTEEVFADIGLRETEPLSPEFEEAGFETKSFLINQGSFLVFLVLGVTEYFGRIVLTKVCIHLARFKIFRMIGIRIDDPTLWATLFRLVMQTYIDIFICVALQGISVSETGWAIHFETPQDSFNTVLAFIIAIVILVFPAYSFLWLRTNRENLSEEDEHGNYWPIYENIRLQSVGPSLYHILFIARRICLVSLLIFSSGVNVFQAIGFLTLSAANLAYLIGWKPFFNPDQNRQEIINETAVYLASHTMFALLNSATPLAFRSQMGWLLVGICILSILYNLFFVIRDLFIFIYSEGRSFRINSLTKKAQLVKLQLMNFQIKTLEEDRDENFCPRLAQLKKDRDMLEQRLLHEEWSDHRGWCLKHKVDLSGWEIEQRYLKNGEALGFFLFLAKEKRLAIERENAQASSHSQKFVDMMKQIKQASQRQSKLNQHLQWLFEVEREGKMTERLISQGSFLGLYKKATLFRFDVRTSALVYSPSQRTPDPPISSEELNFKIVQEQLRLLRESEISDWRSFKSDKDIAKQIESILDQVFENPIPLNQFHPEPTPKGCFDEEEEDRGIIFIESEPPQGPQDQVEFKGKIGAHSGKVRDIDIPSEELPLGDSMTFEERTFSFRAQSTCLNPEEAGRKTSSRFCESVTPSKSISIAYQTGSSFAGPSKKKKKRKARKTQGPLDWDSIQFNPPGKKKKKKKKKLPQEPVLDPFYLDYFQ